MEIKMRKTLMTALGVLLIAGSAAQITPASAGYARRAPAAASEQFCNDYDYSNNGAARNFCSREHGNPNNADIDPAGAAAWRQLGAWDSRNDCP